MVAQSTDDILRELDHNNGGPVQFEDPRNHARYVLLPQADYQRVRPILEPDEPINGETVEWNEAKNERRWELVDREIAGTLALEEAIELRALQQQLLAYRRRVAPIRLEGARKLHADLLKKAAEAEGRG